MHWDSGFWDLFCGWRSDNGSGRIVLSADLAATLCYRTRAPKSHCRTHRALMIQVSSSRFLVEQISTHREYLRQGRSQSDSEEL